MEGGRRRRRRAQRQRRASRVPQGPPLEPARRHVRHGAVGAGGRTRHAACAHAGRRPPGAGPSRRQRLRASHRSPPPERLGDRRLARRRSLLGRSPRPVAGAREDDRHGLPRREPRDAAPRGAARRDRHRDPYRRRLRTRARDAHVVPVRRPGPALPLAEPRLGAAGRRSRGDRPFHPPSPSPRARARARPRSSPPPPRPRPRGGGPGLALARRSRSVGRPSPVPFGARRAVGCDLRAPPRLRRAARKAGALGFTWGLGHATSLFAFGLPIVLYRAYLPEAVQRLAETAVGFLIVGLAVWLLVRWRRGVFHAHAHLHGDDAHVHAHPHALAHTHPPKTRSPLGAYAIGVVHGMGGSAGVGVLLLSAIPSHALAVASLALFAFCTALSMGLLSTGWGLTLGSAPARRSFARLAPVIAVVSLAFGVWYVLGAQSVLPYYF